MLAVSTDDFSVHVIDCDVKRVVRKFNCHTNSITDMVCQPLEIGLFQNRKIIILFSQKGV